MGLSKSFKKAVGSIAAPVFSLPAKGIQKVTGMSPSQQLQAGAGIGAGAGLFGMLGGGTQGAAGAGPTSGRGIMHALTGSGGAGGLLGPMMGAAGSYFGAREQANAQEAANAANIGLAREQMLFSAGQAERQMEFQERMAGSAHQRAMADLKKAGLNPILAAGDGASSPGGAAGSPAGADIRAVPSVLANSVTSALDMVSTFARARQADAMASLAEVKKPLEEAKGPEAEVSRKVWNFINTLMDKLGGWTSGRHRSKGSSPAKRPVHIEGESEPFWTIGE